MALSNKISGLSPGTTHTYTRSCVTSGLLQDLTHSTLKTSSSFFSLTFQAAHFWSLGFRGASFRLPLSSYFRHLSLSLLELLRVPCRASCRCFLLQGHPPSCLCVSNPTHPLHLSRLYKFFLPGSDLPLGSLPLQSQYLAPSTFQIFLYGSYLPFWPASLFASGVLLTHSKCSTNTQDKGILASPIHP